MTDDLVHWQATRDHAIRVFAGELPSRETEAAIINVFEAAPEIVTAAITDVAEAKAAGKARSAWAILRKRLEGALDPLRNATATIGEDRAKRIRQAEAWIRTAGLHCPNEAEILHELYDARSNGHKDSSCALLDPWRNDDVLQARMLTLWRTERPRGQRADGEILERAERWKQTQAILASRAEQLAGTTNP